MRQVHSIRRLYHACLRGRSVFWIGRGIKHAGVPCLILAAGCSNIRPYRAAIQSDTPHERILGIHAAAEHMDQEAVPLLVERLEDEDQAVRFYAILALDRITGRRLGYDYAKPTSERAASVEKWRQFVRNGGHTKPVGAESRPARDGIEAAKAPWEGEAPAELNVQDTAEASAREDAPKTEAVQ